MSVKIVHTITKLELGGAQQNTLFTLNNLPDNYEGYLICSEGGYLDDEARGSKNFKTLFCPFLKREISPIDDLKAYLWMVKTLKLIAPDILHSHSSKAGILSRWAAKRAGVPVVIHTFHGFGFTPLQPAVVRRFFIFLERITARISTKLIFVSNANRKKAWKLGIGDEDKYIVVRSGIDIERFSNPYLRSDRQKNFKTFWGFNSPVNKVVGNVSCFKPQKGLHVYIEACRRLKEKGDYGFILIGDGRLRHELEEQVASCGLTDSFKFFGWRADTPALMSMFDVMLHTAYFEGLARVFLEAMALSVPVIATDVDGAKDVIKDGVNGYLVQPDDIDAMVKKTHELLQSSYMLKKMGEESRKMLKPEFDIHEMSKRLNTLYSELSIAGD